VKILVCGDRNWHDKEAVWWALYGFPKETELIHGACRGADMLADIPVLCRLGGVWESCRTNT
jgi:hypothetical protein